jgi:hypothetical protein
MLKWTIKGMWERGCGLNLADWVQNPVVGSCEHSSELSGSIKSGNMFWPAEWLSAFEEGLFSMEQCCGYCILRFEDNIIAQGWEPLQRVDKWWYIHMYNFCYPEFLKNVHEWTWWQSSDEVVNCLS